MGKWIGDQAFEPSDTQTKGTRMCGVAAILSTRTLLATAAVKRMISALEHRGPDNSGIACLAPCHLGHTRLNVIDPTGGSQPMSDSSGRFHVSFNGEIYNF